MTSLFWICPLAVAITASSVFSRRRTNSRWEMASLSGRGACTTTARCDSSRSTRVVRCMTSWRSEGATASRSRISSFSIWERLRTRNSVST